MSDVLRKSGVDRAVGAGDCSAMARNPRLFQTRTSLCDDILRLGVRPGDSVMVHAAVSKVGRLLNGPDTLIGALLDAVGPLGTILAYTDWNANYEELLDVEGRVPPVWRDDIAPFDPAASRASRTNGILAEAVRMTRGAARSGNPGASVAAVGLHANWFTSDHPFDYGYGPGSPFAKLVAAGGKVMLIGAPFDTLSLLHHAEHLAPIAGKRIRRYEVPLVSSQGSFWRMIEEYDTAGPIVPGLADDYFRHVVRAFIDSGSGTESHVGDARSILVEAAPIVSFAIEWLVRNAPST